MPRRADKRAVQLSQLNETLRDLAAFPEGTPALSFGSLTGGRLLLALQLKFVDREMVDDEINGGVVARYRLNETGRARLASLQAEEAA